MGFPTRLAAGVFCLVTLLNMALISAQPFKCTSAGTCDALVEYFSPNATTLSRIKSLFNVKNLRSLLGANNLPINTPSNRTVAADEMIRIPFPCRCFNGSGISNRTPIYKVVKDDGLYHIAAEIFSGLMSYERIQAVNNIPNASSIEVGQKLWIPLPCSCDEVDGQRVVHYGHVVANGSSVAGIAQQFNTTEQTLLRLNGLDDPKKLEAGALLQVPLRACASNVGNNSVDYPLLLPNGTYGVTAANCVTCKCDDANNWTLKCEPSQIKSSLWPSCPLMQCNGTENLSLGKSTSSSDCNRMTCSYAGYTNQTILTTLASENTCAATPTPPNNGAVRIGLQGCGWSFLLLLVHLVMICLRVFL